MFRSSIARLGKNSFSQIERAVWDIGSLSSMSSVSVVTAQARNGLSRKGGLTPTRLCMMRYTKSREAGCCSFVSSYYSGHGMQTPAGAKFGRIPPRDVRGFNDSNGGGSTGGGGGGGGGKGDGEDESSGKGFFGMLWVMYLASLNKNPVRWCLVLCHVYMFDIMY